MGQLFVNFGKKKYLQEKIKIFLRINQGEKYSGQSPDSMKKDIEMTHNTSYKVGKSRGSLCF